MKDKNEILKTIDVLALASLVAFMVFKKPPLLWLALFFIAVNVLELKLGGKIAELWLKFAHLIGTFNSKILLSLIFFVFLYPLSILYRAFNKESTGDFRNRNRISQFDPVNKSYDKASFEKQW
ncbi:MAG: SxtJ family membrane protein [Nitrospirae bacterium YQR-1]